jgi:hypothetical protein
MKLMDLTDSLEQVRDRESFLEFVRVLIRDREASVAGERESPSGPWEPDAGGWENSTIESFLDAALAWAESTGMGLGQGMSEGPSWQAFASFLYCGKVYE